jgi:hypothetical protein
MGNEKPQKPFLINRKNLVYFYISLSLILFFLAFILAWFSKNGANVFILAGLLTACWASVIATTKKISPKDLSIFNKQSS